MLQSTMHKVPGGTQVVECLVLRGKVGEDFAGDVTSEMSLERLGQISLT